MFPRDNRTAPLAGGLGYSMSLAFLHHGFGLWPYSDIPDFTPNLGCGSAQSCRMARAKHSNISVVVDIDVAWSPPNEHGIPRVQNDADSRFEAVRPVLN